MIPVLIGLAALAFALYWLSRLKQKDVGETAAVLGLSVIASGAESRGTTAEGFDFHQRVLARGVVAGVPAELATRTVRTKAFRRARRTPTQLTVLTLRPTQPVVVALRLQPSGLMRDLESMFHDAPAARPTGDGPFDAAYHLYSGESQKALTVLSPELRQALLGFRATSAVSQPGSTTDYVTSANLLGTFEVSGDSASYYVYGSPTKKLAEHLKQAAPLLAALAGLRDGQPH